MTATEAAYHNLPTVVRLGAISTYLSADARTQATLRDYIRALQDPTTGEEGRARAIHAAKDVLEGGETR